MPKIKKNGEGKGKKADPAAAQTADDFDDMLADFRAADFITTPAASTSSSSSTASSAPPSNAPISSSSRAYETEEKVPEATIVQACTAGDITRLRRWARMGVRVSSGQPLFDAAAHGKLDIMRCLVKELGADVNQTAHNGITPLLVAVQFGRLDVARCLVKELGADVNQASLDGVVLLDGLSPIHIAAEKINTATVSCLVEELGADVNQAAKDGLWSNAIVYCSPGRSRGRGAVPGQEARR
jgi:hypothetical protein